MPTLPSSDPPTPISEHPSGMSCTTVLSLKTVPSSSERVRRRLPRTRTPPFGRKKVERGEAARRHRTGGRKGAHHSEGRAAEDRLSLHVVEWIEAVLGGEGRRRRRSEEDSDAKQDQHARRRPPVDGGPSSQNDGLSLVLRDGPVDHLRHRISRSKPSPDPLGGDLGPLLHTLPQGKPPIGLVHGLRDHRRALRDKRLGIKHGHGIDTALRAWHRDPPASGGRQIPAKRLADRTT